MNTLDRLIFFIPGVYTVYTRLNRKVDFLSWLFLLPGIICIMNYLWFGEDLGKFSVLFLCYFISWLSIYEIGYIENDTVTVKGEENPTLRISREKIDYAESRVGYIYVLRFLLFAVSCILLGNTVDSGYLPNYIAVVAASFLIFKFHNKLRGRENILTYFGLALTKYIAFTSLFVDIRLLILYVCFWVFLFPLPRTLEHATKVKYRLPELESWIGDMDWFRVKYYASVFILGGGVYLAIDSPGTLGVFLIGTGLFLFFRLFAVALLKYTSLKRTRRSAHNWKENEAIE